MKKSGVPFESDKGVKSSESMGAVDIGSVDVDD